MTYRFTSAAWEEVQRSLSYYESRQSGLGAEFLEELEQAIERILAAPEAWRRLSVRTRRCMLHRFPYGVLYQIRGDDILIVSIMDLRRAPSSWRKYL